VLKSKAIFFDRDGVVNYRPVGDYVKTPFEFHFIPDFLNFFKKIKDSGYLAILISNQQGVGKGIMTEEQLTEVTCYMQDELLRLSGFNFDDIYYCTDLKESNSPRRKPNPGMLLEAIAKWDFDPVNSWMVGDSESDIIAGKRARVRTVLLTNIPALQTEAHHVFISLTKIENIF